MTGKLYGLAGAVLVSTSSAALATDLSNSTTGTISDGRSSINYRLFEPSAAAGGDKLPLVVFLHGMGDRGTDNVSQTSRIGGLVEATRGGQYAGFVLAPQIRNDDWFQSWGDRPTDAMALTIKAVKNVIATENVDPSRVYVTGLSMGGMGTWDILRREPNLFAAAVPISGGGDVRSAGKVKDTAIWAFHGGADDVVPVAETRKMVDALRDAGGDPKYTEVAGGGHDIWAPIYDDAAGTLYPWLFAQHRGADAAVAPPGGLVISGDVATAVKSVPEPGAIGAVGIAALATLGRRSRRSRTL